MADRGVTESRKRKRAAKPASGDLLVADAGGFDFSAILAVADAIPVMIAYVDNQQRYRFVNRTLADWFERPRAEILGKTLREVLGEAAYSQREPMVAAALTGERQQIGRAHV